MAQPPSQQQHQYAHPPRAYSPQGAHSPGASQPFPQPPSKRQKFLSDSNSPHSQPPSTYAPYGPSPNGSAHGSPHFPNVQLPANTYNTPYTNGHTPPSSFPPQSQQGFGSHPYLGGLNNLGLPNATPASKPPNWNDYGRESTNNMPLQALGAMGPPSKPVDKSREEMDTMDVLTGSGVNLHEEEQYMYQINSGSFGSQSGTISSGPSFTQFPPGNEASFYGAGPANAAVEVVNASSQEEHNRKLADRAWTEAAFNLSRERSIEWTDPFLVGPLLHPKIDVIATKHGLGLHRVNTSHTGVLQKPHQFPREVNIKTASGPDSSMSVTSGTFIPNDAMLTEQMMLLALATKHRLRELVEDATKLARGRQKGSHGIIPEEWADVAEEPSEAIPDSAGDGSVRAGWESAISPHSNPLKRSFSSVNLTPVLDNNQNPTGKLQAGKGNDVITALRTVATSERDLEEIRLKKRQARAAGEGVPRQGSAVPGTPGSVAPDPIEKAPTKKEQKKKLESKASEAANHIAANTTTAQFLGGGNNIFGKKKKYAWMTSGAGAGSGASTPGRLNTGSLSATVGGPVQPVLPERLTSDPGRRPGQFREDTAKGHGIQLRDWVAVLEQDGHAPKPLQRAYLLLDASEPK